MLGTFKKSGFFSTTTTGSKSAFEGLIYEIKKGGLEPTRYGKDQKLPEELSKLKDVGKKVADISGNWLQ